MPLIEKVLIYDNIFPSYRQYYAVLFVVFLLEFFITAISRSFHQTPGTEVIKYTGCTNLWTEVSTAPPVNPIE